LKKILCIKSFGVVMNRVKLRFSDLIIEFIDRDKGIKQIYEFAEKGTWHPVVVFGPEGCGKTSWLLQAVEILKDLSYGVIYFNPLRKQFEAEVGIESLRQRALDIVKQAASEHVLAKLIWVVIDFINDALRYGRKKLAIVVDDAFQYLGLREATAFVKGILEIIEHPDVEYERIVAIIATSEGLSRYEIGRHRWALIRPMWNMCKRGFEELYELIQKRVLGNTPNFDDVWRLTGGNPDIFLRLYQARWNVDEVIDDVIKSKKLTPSFIANWRNWLEKAIGDPDTLWSAEVPEELINKLIERNLIVYDLYNRDPWFWIDEPPPEKDLEIGVGKYIAWQTPLYREAIKKTLHIYS